MGGARRAQPKFLAQKLKTVRQRLNVGTYEEMLLRLNYSLLPLDRSSIAKYEKGELEPPLPILLRYAQLANVYVDVLIDDELELPDELPAPEKSSGVPRRE